MGKLVCRGSAEQPISEWRGWRLGSLSSMCRIVWIGHARHWEATRPAFPSPMATRFNKVCGCGLLDKRERRQDLGRALGRPFGFARNFVVGGKRRFRWKGSHVCWARQQPFRRKATADCLGVPLVLKTPVPPINELIVLVYD